MGIKPFQFFYDYYFIFDLGLLWLTGDSRLFQSFNPPAFKVIEVKDFCTKFDVKLAGTKMVSIMLYLSRSTNDHWTSILDLHHKLKKMSKHSLEEGTEEEVLEKTGLMFAAIILFLQTVWEYCRVVNRLDVICK